MGMGVPSSQLTANFSAKYQLTTIFGTNSQLTSNFSQLLTFTLNKVKNIFPSHPEFSLLQQDNH